MAIIWIVGDVDGGTPACLARALDLEGHDVVCLPGSAVGRALGCQVQPDVALLDHKPSDMSGLEVLRCIRQRSAATLVVMISGFATIPSVVEALRLGAYDYLEKAILVDDLVRFIAQLPLSRRDAPAGVAGDVAPHAFERWAHIVAKVLDSPEDVPTIRLWARSVAHSAGAIRNWCRTANLSVKNSLKLARALRLAHYYDGTTEVSNLLDIADVRTITKFLRLGHTGAPPCQLPISVSDLLDRQCWITHPNALHVLHEALRTRPRPAVQDSNEQPPGTDSGMAREPANLAPPRSNPLSSTSPVGSHVRAGFVRSLGIGVPDGRDGGSPDTSDRRTFQGGRRVTPSSMHRPLGRVSRSPLR